MHGDLVTSDFTGLGSEWRLDPKFRPELQILNPKPLTLRPETLTLKPEP